MPDSVAVVLVRDILRGVVVSGGLAAAACSISCRNDSLSLRVRGIVESLGWFASANRVFWLFYVK